MMNLKKIMLQSPVLYRVSDKDNFRLSEQDKADILHQLRKVARLKFILS